MLSRLAWLALETKCLDRARRFYVESFDLPVRSEGDHEVTLDAGGVGFVLRRPRSVPRGGLHTHFAFSAPAAEYDDWWERLSADHDLVEHRFGDTRSLYCYDPDGNCVEIGGIDDDGSGITGIFEIVLEVADLDRSEALYADFGFETIDRGADRRRIRMAGPVDLELWEPHLGIADARGGVHVDIGFEAPDPTAAIDPIADRVCASEHVENGVRIRDPDGHYVTVLKG